MSCDYDTTHITLAAGNTTAGGLACQAHCDHDPVSKAWTFDPRPQTQAQARPTAAAIAAAEGPAGAGDAAANTASPGRGDGRGRGAGVGRCIKRNSIRNAVQTIWEPPVRSSGATSGAKAPSRRVPGWPHGLAPGLPGQHNPTVAARLCGCSGIAPCMLSCGVAVLRWGGVCVAEGCAEPAVQQASFREAPPFCEARPLLTAASCRIRVVSHRCVCVWRSCLPTACRSTTQASPPVCTWTTAWRRGSGSTGGSS